MRWLIADSLRSNKFYVRFPLVYEEERRKIKLLLQVVGLLLPRTPVSAHSYRASVFLLD